MKRGRALDLALGLLALVLALASKIPIALSPGLHGDDALVALMAKHVVEGCGLPVHVYSFPLQLGAVLNVFLLAPIYALFGYRADTLTLVMQVVTVLLTLSLYLLILRYHGRWAAFGGALCLTTAIPLISLYLLWADHHDWGLFFLTVQLILFFRVYLDRSDRVRDLALFGAISTLAFRVSGATLVFTVVACGLLLQECRHRPQIRIGMLASGFTAAAVAAALAFVGGFRGTGLLFLHRSKEPGSRIALTWESLTRLSERMVASFRLYLANSHGWRDMVLDNILIGMLTAALLLVLVKALRPSRARRDADWESRHDRSLVLYIVAFLLVYAFSPWSRADDPGSAEPAKYMLYTYPAFILLGAHGLRRFPRWLSGLLFAPIAFAAYLTYGMVDGQVGPADETPKAVEFLESQGLTRIYADYNLALEMMAYSGEEIAAANLDVNQDYLPWAEAVWNARRFALVFQRHRGTWKKAESRLQEAGIAHKKWQLYDIVILYDFERDPLPALAPLSRELVPELGRETTPPAPPRYFATMDCSVFPPVPLHSAASSRRVDAP